MARDDLVPVGRGATRGSPVARRCEESKHERQGRLASENRHVAGVEHPDRMLMDRA
jgi:hypothetical protein